MRSYGIEGLQEIIRDHIRYGQWFGEQVELTSGFELMAPIPLNLVCFRIHPDGITDEEKLERVNASLLQKLNDSGKILLTQTKLNGKFVIRFVAGQENATSETVKEGWDLIKKYSEEFLG
jgi:aromatic-L-amino-acid decarboxylase